MIFIEKKEVYFLHTLLKFWGLRLYSYLIVYNLKDNNSYLNHYMLHVIQCIPYLFWGVEIVLWYLWIKILDNSRYIYIYVYIYSSVHRITHHMLLNDGESAFCYCLECAIIRYIWIWSTCHDRSKSSFRI